jgi:hypothetical protein
LYANNKIKKKVMRISRYIAAVRPIIVRYYFEKLVKTDEQWKDLPLILYFVKRNRAPFQNEFHDNLKEITFARFIEFYRPETKFDSNRLA